MRAPPPQGTAGEKFKNERLPQRSDSRPQTKIRLSRSVRPGSGMRRPPPAISKPTASKLNARARATDKDAGSQYRDSRRRSVKRSSQALRKDQAAPRGGPPTVPEIRARARWIIWRTKTSTTQGWDGRPETWALRGISRSHDEFAGLPPDKPFGGESRRRP